MIAQKHDDSRVGDAISLDFVYPVSQLTIDTKFERPTSGQPDAAPICIGAQNMTHKSDVVAEGRNS